MSRFLAEKLPMTDKLIAEKINKLERPITVVFAGGAEWELSDIDVETGLLRIFVSGLLEVREVGEVIALMGGTGTLTPIECFFADYDIYADRCCGCNRPPDTSGSCQACMASITVPVVRITPDPSWMRPESSDGVTWHGYCGSGQASGVASPGAGWSPIQIDGVWHWVKELSEAELTELVKQ